MAIVLAHGSMPPPPSFPGALATWALDPLSLAGIAVAAGLYLSGVQRVARQHPRSPWPQARTRAFLAGLAVLVIALQSPIAAYEGALFWVHMVQHLLITMVAAPLLVLGTPVGLLLRAVGHRRHRQVLRVLRSWPVTVLTNPVLAWLAFAAVMYGSHFSSLYNLAAENEAVHALEHTMYLAAAALFWWCAIGLDPSHWRMHPGVRVLYAFLQMPANTFLALAIYSASEVLYPHYATNARTWGPSPLEDQRMGGAIMWIAGDLIMAVAVALLVAAWMRHEDRVAARIDAELDAARRAQTS